MKFFSILTLLLMITLIISACGAQVTPTLNSVQIQDTVIAAALTVVAETQAAIPTVTPPPPTASFTDTPAATNTLPPLPTLEGTFTSVPSSNSGSGDPCINQVLPATLQGETVKIRIHNSTKATLALSVYLSQTIPQIVCGYRTYTITPGQTLVFNDLVEGCYTLWAWNPEPKDYFIVTNGASSCIDRSDIAVFDISTRRIDQR
ncbi:MAG TPA: hypothetical protein VN843_19625 [Anaerolineales bacterium]|nr:hypothetical protein [Anaerolineales bacterium]